MENLTLETFKEKVFDFSDNAKWKFEGDKPAIIDFYADWCGPCKTLGPVLDSISEEYDGKIDVYKVDVDKNQELSQVFNVQSIPSVLFIPMDEQPQMSVGGIPRTTIEKTIHEVLNIN